MAEHVKNFFVLNDVENELVMTFLRTGYHGMTISDMIKHSRTSEEQVREALPSMAEVINKSRNVSVYMGADKEDEPVYHLTEEFKEHGKVKFSSARELLNEKNKK